LFGGAGFTLQYEREDWDQNSHNNTSDENWFVAAEPGIQLEINLFKWMRLSSGISYRATFSNRAPDSGLMTPDSLTTRNSPMTDSFLLISLASNIFAPLNRPINGKINCVPGGFT
jgi:hypothetical protein